jgi:hypothetical protein
MSEWISEIRYPRKGGRANEISQTLEGDYIGPKYIVQMISVVSIQDAVDQVFDVNGMQIVHILHRVMKSGWYDMFEKPTTSSSDDGEGK